MSYATKEASRQEGEPIRLYLFSRGPLRFGYTTADRTITLGQQNFDPAPVSDSGINFTGQAAADALTVSLPALSEIAQMYRGLAPSDAVELTVWDWHYGEADFIVAFVGTVISAKFTDAYECEITVWSLTASLETTGLHLGWQRSCPHALYDLNCKVNELAYVVTGPVGAFDGQTANVAAAAAYPAGWFSGGYIEWLLPSGIAERRGIRYHNGASLVLLGGTYGLSSGLTVNLYPGCVRTTAACSSKFNNLPNYGGAPALPGRSPFDGNRVW